MKNIGFIGLGNMGSKMSINLAQKNFTVTGYDLEYTTSLMTELDNSGIVLTNDINNAIKDQDVVITMLPDGKALKNVILPNYKVANKGTVFIDSSTVDITTTKTIYDVLKNDNFDFLDAPVSGGVIGAKNATLTFMVGGSERTFKYCEPLFKVMGNKSILCGNSGSGQSIKLCNNMILAMTMYGLKETLNLAKSLNIDLQKLFDVVSTSSGSCWAVNNYFPVKNVGPNSPADNDFLPGFSTNLMVKDFSLAIEAAKQFNIDTKIGKEILERYEEIIKNGRGNLDFSYIVENNLN